MNGFDGFSLLASEGGEGTLGPQEFMQSKPKSKNENNLPYTYATG